MTEIYTCEGYVIAQLEGAVAECDSLRAKVDELEARNRLLEEQLDAPAPKLDALVIEAGRKKLFQESLGSFSETAREDGEPVPFRDWALERMSVYGLPRSVGKDTFLDYFEPEYRALYERER